MKGMHTRTVLWAGLTICSALVAFGAGQSVADLERGERIQVQSCDTSCHDIRPIQMQALDKEGWTNMVNSMVEKGAKIKEEDVPLLLGYLVRFHGPLPDGAGKKIVLDICTRCHDLERVRAHGGGREEWEDTLSSMLNEGAPISDEDFPVILNYLVRNFRVQ
jgi:hypothetical protein